MSHAVCGQGVAVAGMGAIGRALLQDVVVTAVSTAAQLQAAVVAGNPHIRNTSTP